MILCFARFVVGDVDVVEKEPRAIMILCFARFVVGDAGEDDVGTPSYNDTLFCEVCGW